MSSEAITEKLRRYFDRAPADVVVAWLFGSVARGTARADSDVDVALLYARDPPGTLLGQGFDIQAELEGLLGRPVQVVVVNRAPADLVQRVLRDGVLLLERDRSARVRFEVDKRFEYWDMKPIWDAYRRPREAGR